MLLERKREIGREKERERASGGRDERRKDETTSALPHRGSLEYQSCG
jgi:hypothetical protein